MERLNSYQYVIGRWKREVIPDECLTPDQEFTRMDEEIDELAQAHEHYLDTGNAKNAAEEAADVIIRLIGYVDTLGYDVENLLESKLDTIHRKYNGKTNGIMRKNGDSWEAVLKKQKNEWAEFEAANEEDQITALTANAQ